MYWALFYFFVQAVSKAFITSHQLYFKDAGQFDILCSETGTTYALKLGTFYATVLGHHIFIECYVGKYLKKTLIISI